MNKIEILFHLLIKILWKDLKTEIKDLGNKVEDVDRRLCRLEGAFSAKDFCVLKDSRVREKVE